MSHRASAGWPSCFHCHIGLSNCGWTGDFGRLRCSNLSSLPSAETTESEPLEWVGRGLRLSVGCQPWNRPIGASSKSYLASGFSGPSEARESRSTGLIWGFRGVPSPYGETAYRVSKRRAELRPHSSPLASPMGSGCSPGTLSNSPCRGASWLAMGAQAT